MAFKDVLVEKANLVNCELEKYVKNGECPESVLNESVEEN